jgi:hypothetical protein
MRGNALEEWGREADFDFEEDAVVAKIGREAAVDSRVI